MQIYSKDTNNNLQNQEGFYSKKQRVEWEKISWKFLLCRKRRVSTRRFLVTGRDWRGGEIIGRNESRCRSCLSSRLENPVPVKSVSLNVRGDVTTFVHGRRLIAIVNVVKVWPICAPTSEKKPDERTPLKFLLLSFSFEIRQAFH